MDLNATVIFVFKHSPSLSRFCFNSEGELPRQKSCINALYKMYFRYLSVAFFALVLSLSMNTEVRAVTFYTILLSDGVTVAWSNTNGGPPCGCRPETAPNGSNGDIFVNHNITLTSSFTLGGELNVASGVTLTVDGNLTFNNNSVPVINGDLIVNGDFQNKNNSRNVVFNGTVTISGSFSNGNGGIINLGPTATIAYNTSGNAGNTCSNVGTVIQNGVPTTGNCGGPLPVQLSFFEATQIETEIQLTWATTSEKNFQYFAIERADAELNWEEVGTVEGAGTSQVRVDYEFTDEYPGLVGILYYRLKAVDFDGYTEYFRVVSVNYQAPKAWYISPNPVEDGDVVLMRNFAEDEVILATLYSMTGSEILNEQISVTTDHYVFTTDLNPGLYVLKLKDSHGVRNLRFAVE